MKSMNITIGSSNKLKKHDAHFLIKLSELLSSGFTMQQALSFLVQQYDILPQKLKDSLLTEIMKGHSLSQILKQLGYSKSIIMQVSFAEIHGEIIQNLYESGEYLKMRRKTKSKIIKAIQYPLVLISIFIIMLILLNFTVIPQFNELYSAMQADKSLLVMILTLVLNYLPHVVLICVSCLCLFILLMVLIYKQKKTTRAVNTLLKIPLISTYFRYYVTYRFSREFGYFLINGLEVKEILLLFKTQTINRFLSHVASTIEEELLTGSSLASAIEKMKLLDKRLAVFVNQGEYNSNVGKELIIYSEYTLDNILIKIEALTQKIQPIIFLILGLLIICLYLVIVMPIFNMLSTIS